MLCLQHWFLVALQGVLRSLGGLRAALLCLEWPVTSEDVKMFSTAPSELLTDFSCK
jgi:hypothetical protein